jgi:hypothetical protein
MAFQFLLENLDKADYTVMGPDGIMSNQPRTRDYLQLRKSDVGNKDLFLYSRLMSVKFPVKSGLRAVIEFFNSEHLL